MFEMRFTHKEFDVIAEPGELQTVLEPLHTGPSVLSLLPDVCTPGVMCVPLA